MTHRVAVADQQLEVVALDAGAVADADDLETLLEAVGDALDHVGDERPREPVQRAVLAAVGRPLDRMTPSPTSTIISRGTRWVSSPLGPFTVTTALSYVNSTPSGSGIGAFPILDMCRPYQMKQMTSPPRPSFRASALVTRPRDVEMIAVPSPPSTLGSVSLRGVDATPGLGDALDAGDDALPVLAVLELDDDDVAVLALLDSS